MFLPSESSKGKNMLRYVKNSYMSVDIVYDTHRLHHAAHPHSEAGLYPLLSLEMIDSLALRL